MDNKVEGVYDFKGMKPEYNQVTKFRCTTCGAENEALLKHNLNWKTRCHHAESVIAYILCSMNDIIKEVEQYSGCEMNKQMKVLWKQKVRFAINKLKDKRWRNK